MIHIIRLRPLKQYSDLRFAKWIKPFEDAGLVIDLERDAKQELELVFDIINDKTGDNYYYNHILKNSTHKESPSSLFKHLHARDEMIPTLCYYYSDGNKKRNIRGVHNCHQLQTLTKTAKERNYLN